jgi:drug/metabolite transporter (DMT)-like permease
LTGILLALGAALGWGSADFIAGRTSREIPALVVLWASQWIGLAAVLVAALVVGLDEPVGHDLLYAAIAGAGLVLGLGALYRAMAVGSMAVAAPIAATSVVIPVAFGLASGDDPSTIQAAGLLAAIGGVVLCSHDPEADVKREGRLAAGVGLALLAALGGGITSTALAEASSSGVLWVLLVQRATVGGIALVIVLAQRRSPRPPRNAAAAIVTIGLIDVIATGLYTASTIDGELSLVAVVAALYPVVTVMLAFLVLHERIARHQAIGAFTALAGVALIASG